MTRAEHTLTLLLPHYATAIGSPTSPAAYLRDVVTHSLWWARTQVERGKLRPSGRMTNSQRRECVNAMAFAKTARQMLRAVS